MVCKNKSKDFFQTEEGKEFATKTMPDLVHEVSRFNDLLERALNYYAIETFGKIPRDSKKST